MSNVSHHTNECKNKTTPPSHQQDVRVTTAADTMRQKKTPMANAIKRDTMQPHCLLGVLRCGRITHPVPCAVCSSKSLASLPGTIRVQCNTTTKRGVKWRWSAKRTESTFDILQYTCDNDERGGKVHHSNSNASRHSKAAVGEETASAQKERALFPSSSSVAAGENLLPGTQRV